MAEHSSKSTTPRCVLDENGCLSLSAILSSFNAPINEEHAWAVCYQCAKCLEKEWGTTERRRCLLLTDLGHVWLHKDGTVHPNTVKIEDPGKTRTRATAEQELSNSLGVVIYRSLDYGVPEEEERPLSSPLEHLIELMTSANSSAQDRHDADEGIERDSEELPLGITFSKVMEECANHLPIPTQADSHYKAVCRALVAEALELSTFLQKITRGKEELKELRRNTPDQSENSDLEKLNFSDWARLWVQVIRELRHGVKLKKVVIENLPPSEYELTPYEILMDDIRSRRYKLNKVMVNGDIPPRVKKDAHAIILEFIRSRPPLHPVSERKLKPLTPSPSTPYEALMRSIRQKHRLKSSVASGTTVETSRTKLDENDATPQSTRRLIKVDMSLMVNSDDDDDLPSPSDEIPQRLAFEDDYKSPAENGTSSGTWKRTAALDLATQGASFKPERRHSITVCESPTKPLGNGNGNGEYQWKNSMECLSLTLEEVVHIRSVLTKAELEGLLVDKFLYNEVSKGKVCFTCKKTRFSFFGSWGQKCRLCQRSVCERCCTKMRIPTEHFASIPVFTLSPGSSASSSEEEPSNNKSVWRLPDVSTFLTRRMSVGSAPSSPDLPRHGHSSMPNGVSSSSLSNSPAGTPGSVKRRPLLRSRTLNRADSVRRDKLCGELMTVCKECRAMVKHAIVASRHSLNLNQKKSAGNGSLTNGKSSSPSHQQPPSRDLHLNIEPVYKRSFD